jgi:tRNA A-37 threonylcarbamoyl transferase component Bud32/tetratricopeptide (TPR) repeat protein
VRHLEGDGPLCDAVGRGNAGRSRPPVHILLPPGPPVIDDLQLLRDTLAPRYLLGEEIGRGGMATVYRARDVKHDRDVAVKVLDPSLASAIGLERFEREISIAAGLQHANIVPLYDSGGSGNVLYFIMPLVTGESLRQRIRRETQLPLPDAVAIVHDVAAALSYAHAAGVVHRDIKPENILLSGGKAMVADFGIARAINSAGDPQILTELGVALGTPAYMSPEQAGGAENVDGRADVYALGCVMFEMLAGDPPFSARTAQALLARHLHERPPSLQVVRPTVGEDMQAAVEKALAKVPADRFTSATGFAAALDAAHIASISGATRAERVRHRPRSIVGVAAVALAALLLTPFVLDRDPVADPNRVVVYPLSVPGAGASSGAGEQVALMIQSVLEHTEPLKWLDGQALLGPDRADARILGTEASRLTRRAGGRYYLAGALVTDRDSHTVIIRLHDAQADSLLGQESAAGAVASTTAPQLAMRAVALLLPKLLPPNGRVDVSYVADRNPAAVADWLQGEREYARSRYTSAMQHINRALAKDSALGVAALKGALASTYLQDYPSAGRLLDVAFRHTQQLPRHQLALARGLRHHVEGRADSALTVLAEASAIDSTWSEPWIVVAETYLHLMPSNGVDADSAAEQSLNRALRLQPGFAPALFHLVEYPTRRGDARRARALMREIEAAAPDSDWVFQADLMVRCAFEGPASINWQQAVQRHSSRVNEVSRILGAGGVNTACARRAAEAVLAYDRDTSANHAIFRWSAVKSLNYLAMAEGKDSAARALLDSVSGVGIPAAGLHFFNTAAGSIASASVVDTEAKALMTRPLSALGVARNNYLLLWAYAKKDVARLDSIANRLNFIADSTGRGTHRRAAESASGRLALIRGDTAAAIRHLSASRPAADPAFVTWDEWESSAGERVLLSRLLLATGDAAGAWRSAQTFDSPRSQIDLLFLAPSLDVRLQAARILGRGADRARIEARLRALGREALVTK